MRRTFLAVLAALLLVAGVAVVNKRTQQSAVEIPADAPAEAQLQPDLQLIGKKSGCHGAGCRGKNPTNLCDGDAITVGSKAVMDGMLELRYSPSCKSNWGRYTPYRRNAYGYTYVDDIALHARVTAWNPGSPSVGSAHTDTSLAQFGTSWSQMVDGTKEACTGVELVKSSESAKSGMSQTPTGWMDKTWEWGPCY